MKPSLSNSIMTDTSSINRDSTIPKGKGASREINQLVSVSERETSFTFFLLFMFIL